MNLRFSQQRTSKLGSRYCKLFVFILKSWQRTDVAWSGQRQVPFLKPHLVTVTDNRPTSSRKCMVNVQGHYATVRSEFESETFRFQSLCQSLHHSATASGVGEIMLRSVVGFLYSNILFVYIFYPNQSFRVFIFCFFLFFFFRIKLSKIIFASFFLSSSQVIMILSLRWVFIESNIKTGLSCLFFCLFFFCLFFCFVCLLQTDVIECLLYINFTRKYYTYHAQIPQIMSYRNNENVTNKIHKCHT